MMELDSWNFFFLKLVANRCINIFLDDDCPHGSKSSSLQTLY